MDWQEAIAKNKRRAALLLAVVVWALFMGLLVPLSMLAPDGQAVLLALVGAVLYVGIATLLALRIGMHSTGARYPDSRKRRERLFVEVVQEMAIASGLPAPRPVVSPDRDINGFSMGLRRQNCFVGATRGALQRLSREELQALCAHEFGHIANGDGVVSTIGLSSLQGLAVLHRMTIKAAKALFVAAGVGFLLGESRQQDRRSFGWALKLTALLGLIAIAVVGLTVWLFQGIAQLCYFAMRRRQEYAADARAVQYTRNPAAFARVLAKTHLSQLRERVQRPRIVAASYFNSRWAEHGVLARLLNTHPPTVKRIERVLGRKATLDEYGNIRGVRPASSPWTHHGERRYSAYPPAWRGRPKQRRRYNGPWGQ